MERGRRTARQTAAPASASAAPAVVFDQMEREQEGIVNKLNREIVQLREGVRSRSQSRSRSSSVSSQTSRAGAAGRGSMSEGEICALRRENDQLRKKATDLTMKLAERDIEIERLRRAAEEKESSI